MDLHRAARQMKPASGANFVHPIRHGARVPLPRADIEQQVLFDL